ncbi:MAG: PcfJ domain-containing protein [Planctomycetota bacterium]
MALEPKVQAAFDALHRGARARSSLLDPMGRRSDLDPVDALRNLALVQHAHIRSIEDWRPEGRSALPLIDSLARHLLGRYPLPRFLARAWFGPRGGDLELWRRAFRAHAEGTPLRQCLPELGLTRRMEHHLLATPEHLGLTAAVRRAEVLALGGSKTLAAAVARSRLGRQLERLEFWRSVLRFFVAHEPRLDRARVERIVEFVEEVRHRPRVVEGRYGPHTEAPPMPDLELRGRTLDSLGRLMADWGRSMALQRGSQRSWAPSGFEPRTYQESPEAPRWQWVELLDAASLFEEGRRLHHCVGTYAKYCRWGWCSVWSLRRQSGSGPPLSVLTLDVDPRTAKVRDVRATCNRDPSGLPRELAIHWASVNGLEISEFALSDRVAQA